MSPFDFDAVFDPGKIPMTEIEEIELTLQKFATKMVIDGALLRDTFAYPAYINAVYSDTIHGMVLSIVQGVYGRTFTHIKVRWIASRWDMFKNKHFPKWLLLFTPVKWKEQVIYADELYPMISMPGKPYAIRVYKEER